MVVRRRRSMQLAESRGTHKASFEGCEMLLKKRSEAFQNRWYVSSLQNGSWACVDEVIQQGNAGEMKQRSHHGEATMKVGFRLMKVFRTLVWSVSTICLVKAVDTAGTVTWHPRDLINACFLVGLERLGGRKELLSPRTKSPPAWKTRCRRSINGGQQSVN
ncbi:hypothetical protein CIRG_09388 [Coccidioides immitis RMSCC 2394]|uniref:Uncharacterized protein n=1 Tax=Coccidioides immitis RMSCC 2394 TaxID=404692 RepID=A0A0J6YQU5_COCIT|nr:hypothetical protein CIRG_09388 [Coccidioides immitis RMSCC 2394]